MALICVIQLKKMVRCGVIIVKMTYRLNVTESEDETSVIFMYGREALPNHRGRGLANQNLAFLRIHNRTSK